MSLHYVSDSRSWFLVSYPVRMMAKSAMAETPLDAPSPLLKTLGFDIGGSFVKSVVLAEDGEVLRRSEDPVEHGGVESLVRMIVSIAGKLDPRNEVAIAGVAIAGLVESGGRVSVSPHLPGLRNFDATSELQSALNRRVVVSNDATAATYAEATLGAAKGFRNVLMLTAGTGVGGGLVLEGRPFEGSHGFAGEIGHLPIDDEGDPCACGRAGCLETAVGAKYLVGRARTALGAGVRSTLQQQGGGLTAADIFEAARRGDALAQSLVDRAGRALGRASAIALQLLDLDRIVLGGGLARSADLLLSRIIGQAQARTFPEIFSRATFVAALLGHGAGAIGAAQIASLRLRPQNVRLSDPP